jgi:REP element-mobilizing transposase RayT
MDKPDLNRLLMSLRIFNTQTAVGSVYEYMIAHRNTGGYFGNQVSKDGLVDIVAFNILPNHYHLLLHQRTDNGISIFMKSLGGGYTKYFNEKYGRSGSLFQGVFKSSHVSSDDHLIRLSAYINLNHIVHKIEKFGNQVSKWEERCSWNQYVNPGKKRPPVQCTPDIVLKQFPTKQAYRKEAIGAVEDIMQQRDEQENYEFGNQVSKS